jgi:3-oxoacyl-[acyl-carrier-protein] synthase II
MQGEKNEQICLTGLSLLTAYGADWRSYWKHLMQGHRALGPASRFCFSSSSPPIVAEVKSLGEGKSEAPRQSTWLRAVLQDVCYAAGVSTSLSRCLLIIVGQAPQAVGAYADESDVHEMVGPEPNELGLTSEPEAVIYLSHACASAAMGLLLAREWLMADLVDFVIVAGASVLNRYEYANMDVVRALSSTGARPFDLERDGTTLGEGAGAIVLEKRKRAQARQQNVHAVLLGGACCVAGESEVALDVDIATTCIQRALQDAGRPQIDYIHAHAPGTVQGDQAELAALEAVAAYWMWDSIPVSSHKGAVGHLMHASAFPAFGAALGFLQERIVPAGAGLRQSEPTTRRLRLIRTCERSPNATAVLVNSFGFCGNYAALVLGEA